MTWIGTSGHCLSLYHSSRSRRNLGHCCTAGNSFSLLLPSSLLSSSFLNGTGSSVGDDGLGVGGGGKGKRICTVHSFLSPVILIILMIISAQSAIATLTTLLIVFPSFILILNYTLPRIRYTNFFVSWTVSSFVLILGVFELEVVPYLEILLYENLIFLTMTSCSLIMAIVIRKRSESLIQTPLLEEYHGHHHYDHQLSIGYCSWLKCSIGASSENLFMTGLAVTTSLLVYGSQLITTTICHPYLAYGSVLLPDDCSDVYSDFG